MRRSFRRDERGVTAVEVAITAPVFFLVLFAIIEGGLMLWTQLGLQHGVQLAARCAGVNTTLCGSDSAVKSFASQQALGVNPDPSIFTVTNAACGKQVTANYTFNFTVAYVGLPSIALSAQSCFPT
jgi:Flp pilus assembly protein TadG